MEKKTSEIFYAKYGGAHKEEDLPLDNYKKNEMTIEKGDVNSLYSYDENIYIEVKKGVCKIFIGESCEVNLLEEFTIHRIIKINKGLFFALSSVTDNASIIIYTIKGIYNIINISKSIEKPNTRSLLNISEILGYFYSEKGSEYFFHGEKHSYYELTYVDYGELVTQIDDKEYQLVENEVIIYDANSYHTQKIGKGKSCSYLTILFYMDFENYKSNIEEDTNLKVVLFNKSFKANRIIQMLLKAFVEEGSSRDILKEDILISLLHEIIVRLISKNLETNEEKKVILNTVEYQSDLANKIIKFIEDNKFKPISVEDLCLSFGMSRSSLQNLFKTYIKETPKKYITNVKLTTAKDLLRQNKYTVSQVSQELGFLSIHHFTKLFTEKYNISPGRYSKKLYK